MAELKTKPSEVSVDAFLDAIEHPVRREDGKAVRALMERLSGRPAAMWGPTIIGFGTYRYKYDSGHEGEMCRIGFSPRKAELVFYLGGIVSQGHPLLARLGKHRTSKACLYVKKLADIDTAVLEDLVRDSLAYMDEAYPA
ncbi:DUF1801 domain-containing protein [Sphingomonas sp.]|uniref:DUF1801 domain-containing protein n=1 Tax=Sphingomonas sp. TaxID=28214 RepID=UPI001AFD56AE|nr:DUF1801 domain-containing protein [Sphingomonas sp.]MBO9714370.1 DUF1801 domain-containing protein [Sphingomonas sp.]